ncbi:MAG: CoA pyrophosphatase [Alphaproteobacteria bacterium]|nr:CoA pyrophosphatase [Alphaproteobacteria bacterium]
MTEQELRVLVTQKLLPLNKEARPPVTSDFDLNPQYRAVIGPRTLRQAAVLVPLITREAGLSVLFTQRAADLPSHAGQVSFPGGRVQPEDDGPVGTALRETQEETGIAPRFVEPLGMLDPYETVTGFAVSPVVGLVHPGFDLKPDPREVAHVFEAPFTFLMNPANQETHTREWEGRTRVFYAVPYDGHYIWGATAGMLMNFYRRLFES